MKCFRDGNQLCVVRDDFVNLEESPVVFVPLTSEQMAEIDQLKYQKQKVM